MKIGGLFYYLEKIEDKIFALQKSQELLNLKEDPDLGKLIVFFDYSFIIKKIKDFFEIKSHLLEKR